MVGVSTVFQQPKFQSLCHDLLFHYRFLFDFCLWYFKQTVILFIYIFFMFYSMVDKFMTHQQRFSVFWQQAGHVEIYIVLINTINQVKELYIFGYWWLIEYLVATLYELWMM